MKKPRDWEKHHALLWKHDSAKFNKPTPRMLEQPVIQVFGNNMQTHADKGIFWASALLLAILAAIGLVNKFFGTIT